MSEKIKIPEEEVSLKEAEEDWCTKQGGKWRTVTDGGRGRHICIKNGKVISEKDGGPLAPRPGHKPPKDRKGYTLDELPPVIDLTKIENKEELAKAIEDHLEVNKTKRYPKYEKACSEKWEEVKKFRALKKTRKLTWDEEMDKDVAEKTLWFFREMKRTMMKGDEWDRRLLQRLKGKKENEH